jgi:fructose-bisphosphate aldolase class I
VGKQILAKGLVPIIEPEVTITIADKSEAEEMLRDVILAHLDALADDQMVMLKLTLPEVDNLYKPLVDHPRVLKVVALSGGYNREEANDRLSRQTGMIASFSRALTEGLSANQTDEQFNAVLDASIQSIRDASVAG